MTAPSAGSRRPRRTLDGAAALVTGASSGVGRAVALELAGRGVRVLVTARRGDRLASLADDATARGLGTIAHEAGDITLADVRRRLVAAAVERFGGLDIVVAAAGSGAVGRFGDASPDTLRRIMDVDFLAPAELVRAALPTLLQSPDPAIVLVGSILGRHPLPWHAEYCAAKAALASLAGSLRLEYAADGIDVLLATLGPTDHGGRPRAATTGGPAGLACAGILLGHTPRPRPDRSGAGPEDSPRPVPSHAMTPPSPAPPDRLLSVACPTCSATIAVEAVLLGLAAECPLCGQGFRLPQAAATAAPPARHADGLPAGSPGGKHDAKTGTVPPRPAAETWSRLESRLESQEVAEAGDDQTAQLKRASADRTARRARRNVVMLLAGGSLLLGIVMLLGRKRR